MPSDVKPADAPTSPPPPTVGPGRIDIHCHLIPGLDDGCQAIEESLACVRRLTELQFAGCFCTPHMIPEMFPRNTPTHIRGLTQRVRESLAEAGLNFQLWPGGELRLARDAIAWMQTQGVPTLGDSRCVLTDFWDEGKWPRWVHDTLRWLLDHRYQPILAHPERLPPARDLDARLRELQTMGVWLQGNFACMTGEEGFAADQTIRRLLAEERYQFLALDMHRPDTLEGRLDGLSLVAAEFGPEVLDRLTIDAPRRLVLSESQA